MSLQKRLMLCEQCDSEQINVSNAHETPSCVVCKQPMVTLQIILERMPEFLCPKCGNSSPYDPALTEPRCHWC